jgi:hypothetical protein
VQSNPLPICTRPRVLDARDLEALDHEEATPSNEPAS